MAPGAYVIEVERDLQRKVDEVQQSMLSADADGYWQKRSIYKLPLCITDANPKAYCPRTVSFGPYHHGKEHLKPMEKHKIRALHRFLKRSQKPLQHFVGAMSEVLDDLMACYLPLDQEWCDQRNAFMQLMILDGCFMLEVLRIGSQTMDGYAPNDPMDGYAANDPVFSDHGRLYFMPFIQRDMLMLENQLPMLALTKLLDVESRIDVSKVQESVNLLILKFFGSRSTTEMGKHLHVLDVYRKNLLKGSKPPKMSPVKNIASGDELIRTATELHDAGIQFKKSSSNSLKDVTFSEGVMGLRSGILMLPRIIVDDMTETMLLNLVAFERFLVGAGNEVTSYIFFMDKLIDNEKDVALLHSQGIIENVLESDEAVAKLFNSLAKDVALEPGSSLELVHKKVREYCDTPYYQCKASLWHKYFQNPWALISLIAAIFLFGLTIIQTVYSALQYYQGQGEGQG